MIGGDALPCCSSGSADRWGALPAIRGTICCDEPMSRHTSFAIGGPADVLATPADTEDLRCLLQWARERRAPVLVLGAGSNLLASDRGVRGLVVSMGAAFSRIEVRGTRVVAGAAARLPVLLRHTLGAGLAGLECLAGIPGTVGGAVRMNAGTSGGCIGESLVGVSALDGDLHEVCISASGLGLGYRRSRVGELGLVITDATFELTASDAQTLNAIVADLLCKRKSSQPCAMRTAGSVFKNPSGGYAGRILDELGAKGMQVGGARVSMKHANFIENTGVATADDVWRLVKTLQQMAAERLGVALEPEIERVGEWGQGV